MLWLQAFLLTQLVEVPIYLLALRTRPAWQRPLAAFGASALTHPLVWLATASAPAAWFWTVVAASELAAVAVEALYLRALGAPRPLLWSLSANAASFGTGLLLVDLGLLPL